jgi:2,4-dienoyl-CoA reductase-like NADH-dependent reductase (Old Yellow Enzyme family)
MKSKLYTHLLSPGRIGAMMLRNRIVVTAMGVNMAETDGSCGDRLRAYHEAQAMGGAGMIIMGASGVSWPVGGVQVRQIAVSDDRFIPGVGAVAEAVHRHGCKLAMQLHMGGPNSVEDMLAGRPVYVPSIPELLSGYAAALLPEELDASAFGNITAVDFHVMTRADIQRFVADFAAAAGRALRAGVDGVEIHGGHGYLLSAFLSPKTNQRTDEYGGSLENRARLLLEVIAAIRDRVGRDYPLWVKLDSREIDKPGGIAIEDAVQAAILAERAGVDAITVSAYHGASGGKLDAGSHTPNVPAQNLPYAAQIKAAVKVPVIASGKIEPAVADDAIASGKADFISMGRKILADPALPQKLSEGREGDIRPCIYCYTCISAIFTQEATRCAVNPETGLEYLASSTAIGGQRIVVIGGGPAGMETARRLDRDGHTVILLEREKRLGGTLNFAAVAYEDNERLLTWLRRQVETSKVDVRLGTEATPELLRSLAPDRVVVATGAVRSMPPIPGNHLPHVFSGDDLRQLILGGDSDELKRKTGYVTRLASRLGALSGATANPDLVRKATRQWMPLGDAIVIIGGELVGLELAEFLMERGRRVTVVDEAPKFGAGLTILRRVWVLDELTKHGVALYAGAAGISISDDAVRFTDSGGQVVETRADHVIVAKGACGDLGLADKLRGEGFVVDVVGDCTGVGYIEGSMRGAATMAAKISAA